MLARLHEQASLQLGARESGELAYTLRTPEEGRGFARLPRPSAGDVFFDMEGDPFFDDGGLEYLFGDGHRRVTGTSPSSRRSGAGTGTRRGSPWSASSTSSTERRRRFPDLHVYHYNHYEVTALKRLAGAHGTREEELDQLLRDEVFVDLYKVVKEGMLISQPSYSIKKVEAFYMDERDTAVTDGGDSVIMFERWLEQGDRRDPGGDRRLQPRRLRLDPEAARLAARSAGGGRARVRGPGGGALDPWFERRSAGRRVRRRWR